MRPLISLSRGLTWLVESITDLLAVLLGALLGLTAFIASIYVFWVCLMLLLGGD